MPGPWTPTATLRASRRKSNWTRLQNEQQLAFGVYSQLAQQLENAKIKVQEQMPCVTIIEPASVPVNRSNMGKPTILFIFVFLGLMAGIGYVVIKDLFFQPADSE